MSEGNAMRFSARQTKTMIKQNIDIQTRGQGDYRRKPTRSKDPNKLY